jgi:hypothetical protein
VVRLTTSAAANLGFSDVTLAGFGLGGSTSPMPKRAARALRFSNSSSTGVAAATAGAGDWVVSLATGVDLGGDAWTKSVVSDGDGVSLTGAGGGGALAGEFGLRNGEATGAGIDLEEFSKDQSTL